MIDSFVKPVVYKVTKLNDKHCDAKALYHSQALFKTKTKQQHKPTSINCKLTYTVTESRLHKHDATIETG